MDNSIGRQCVIRHNEVMKKFLNLLFYAGLAYLVLQRVPSWIEMYRSQGKQAPASVAVDFENKPVEILNSQKKVVIFWATWCGPCEIELSRINKMIQDRKIKPEQVIAISSRETAQEVQAAIQQRKYLFTNLLDPRGIVADEFQVQATPTLVLIDENNIVQWKTMGLSPSLEIRISRFLN